MIVAFFESFKYVGHLFPLSFFRIYLGYVYLNIALEKLNSDYLDKPELAGLVNAWLDRDVNTGGWYHSFLEGVVVPYWQVFAYFLMICEMIIAISYILGFLVRPVAALAAFISINFLLLSYGSWLGKVPTPLALGGSLDYQIMLPQILLMIHIMLSWMGAGRCLGIDYFFFKKNRGIWW